MGILTDGDKLILPIARRERGGFATATKWYFKDWEPLWYQYLFHQAPQRNTTFVAGIAAGKSTIVAASYFIDCLTTPYFRALNTSVTAKQAEIPFEMASLWIEDNPKLEHLVDNVALRPYPIISFKNGAEWIFRTAGKDARFIRGLEFDRINYDEAGLDFDGMTAKVLRGRLRGVRVDGTERMARMDVITSPTDAPWLRERFDRGWKGNSEADLKRYLSIRASTYMNSRLGPEQIKLMEMEYTDDMIAVELGGEFPEYGMSFFNKKHIHACTDQSLNDAVYEALNPEDGKKPKRGYVINEHPRYGVTHFEMPFDPRGNYVLASDPGTDGPPRRNAGVVIVADASKHPSPIVYFDWVDGRGSYNPFLNSFRYAMNKYKCSLRGMDTTGTQKAIDELAFENMGIDIDGINFSRDKDAMINSLVYSITNHELKWPVIKGLVRQMSSYDRAHEDKFPQDIVMTLAELAFLMRFKQDQDENDGYSPPGPRGNSRRRSYRTNSSRRRR